MRYIDEAEAIALFQSIYIRRDWSDREIHFSLRDVIANLSNVKTADPRIKAHWDLDDEETICSNCGKNFEGDTTTWKYCPNCGADTRGKDMQNNIMQHFIAALVRSGMSQEEAEAQMKKEFGEL